MFASKPIIAILTFDGVCTKGPVYVSGGDACVIKVVSLTEVDGVTKLSLSGLGVAKMFGFSNGNLNGFLSQRKILTWFK